MLTRLIRAVAVLLLAAPGAGWAQGVAGNIVTGARAGTAIEVGRDIAAVAAECGVAIGVQESAGSVENVLAVRDRPQTQLGIVQTDVLEYFRTFEADDPAIRRTAQGIRVAFPLYDEEVHVLARREVRDFAGLAGRRVAVGVADSGTGLTAGLMLDLAQVEPAERRAIGPAQALDALLGGEIDAFFYVVGAPAALFGDARIDPQAYHLLPLTAPVLTTVYEPAEIAAGTYPFVTAPVDLVAVRAVLVTYDFDPGRNAYHAASCRLVAEASHLIVSRLDRLRETGHPKWKDVNMTDLPPGWEVGDCVLAGLAPDFAFRCERPDGTVTVEGAAQAGQGPNAVFLSRVCARIGC